MAPTRTPTGLALAVLLAACFGCLVTAGGAPFGRKQGIDDPLVDAGAGIPLAPFAHLALRYPQSNPGRIANSGLNLIEALRARAIKKELSCYPTRKGPGKKPCLCPGSVISATLSALRSAWIVLTKGTDALRDTAATSKALGLIVTAHKALLVAAMRGRGQRDGGGEEYSQCVDRMDWFNRDFENTPLDRFCILRKVGEEKAAAARVARINRALRAGWELVESQLVVGQLLAVKKANLRLAVPPHRGAWRGEAEAAVSRNIVLNNGISVPRMAFGTGGAMMDEWRHDECKDKFLFKSLCESKIDATAVANIVRALKVGFRFIDTAALYNNVGLIGKAIKQSIASGVLKSADEVRISTKVGLTAEAPRAEAVKGEGVGEHTRAALQRQMRELGVSQLHLAEVHHDEIYSREVNTATRKQLAAMVQEGLVLALADKVEEMGLKYKESANFVPQAAQHTMHAVLSDYGWDGTDTWLTGQRQNMTIMGFDLYRDQGVPVVKEVLDSLASMAGLSDSYALLYAWALRKRAIVITLSLSEKHLRSSFTEPFKPLPPSVFAATDSVAWLASWCPPCETSNDGFGIYDGLFRAGGTWEALEDAGLHRKCAGVVVDCAQLDKRLGRESVRARGQLH